MLCGLWKLPFRHHGAIKLTQSCVCFTNPCSTRRVSSSLFRLPSLANTIRMYLNVSTCSSAFPLTCTIQCLGASWETQYLSLFSADFHSCLVARSRRPIKCVPKTLLRRSTQAEPNRPQKANDSSCSFQQWHPSRLVCDCLYPSYVQPAAHMWPSGRFVRPSLGFRFSKSILYNDNMCLFW